MSGSRTVEKALRELETGRVWRAKEILQGRIGSHGYDPTVFEAYGRVLLRMGDLVEAGKYLFLSGARMPAYEEAIALYLTRYLRTSARHLHSSFPACVRGKSVEALPRVVREELERRGYSEGEVQNAVGTAPRSTWRDAVVAFGCLAILLVLIALFFLGVFSGLRTFVEWFR